MDKTTLRAAVASGLLMERRIAKRNVIDASKQAVVNHGLNVSVLDTKMFVPENLRGRPWTRKAYVVHNGGRARIIATQGDARYYRCQTDISSCYERNVLAEELFAQPSTHRDTGDPAIGGLFGDALLFTELKSFWMINPELIFDDEDLEQVSEILSTSHKIINIGHLDHTVLFDEPPVEDELVALQLWAS